MWIITLLKGVVLAFIIYQAKGVTNTKQGEYNKIDDSELIKDAMDIIDNSCRDVVCYWTTQECEISADAFNSFLKLSNLNNKLTFRKGKFINSIIFMNEYMGYIFLVTLYEPRVKGINSKVLVEYVCMKEEYKEDMFYTFCKRDPEEYLKHIPKEIISQVDDCIYDWVGTDLNEIVVSIPSIYYEPIYELSRVNSELVQEHEEEYAVVFTREFDGHIHVVTIYEPDEEKTLTNMRVKYLCSEEDYNGDLLPIH